MYLPKHFKVNNQEEQLEFVKAFLRHLSDQW